MRPVFDSTSLYAFDDDVRVMNDISLLCGVDEAGRGPLCGPVAVAAVILNPANPILGINDSKKLSEKKREALYPEIIQRALAYKVVFVSPEEIDRINILQATLLGMCQAVQGLTIQPSFVLVDGNSLPTMPYPCQPVTKGDTFSASIAAASVLAKVERDHFMQKLDEEYPQYKLAQHKGYPTKLHYELLRKHGIQSFYRRSFLKKQGY